MKSIIIWGVGNKGKMFNSFVDRSKCKVVAFTDSDCRFWGHNRWHCSN